jgi:predicted nucleotidyltransferase
LVREKTVSRPTTRTVRYDQSRWDLLRGKRSIAEPVMRKISRFDPLVHGSLARGDVREGSDVDIVLTQPVPSYTIEISLDDEATQREIVQATPWHLVKGQIYLDDDVSVTFPLVKPTPLEEQFYAFGGAVNLNSVEKGLRTPGIDKRLMLIEPLEDGHRESSIIGRESIAAKKIGVGLEIVKERIDVLSRRDAIGRTGVYLKRSLSPDESFESVLNRLASRDPNLKRRVLNR